MKTVTEYTNNLFNSPDRKWVAPTAVLVAITLIAGVLYYGGYLDKLLSGAKASDIHTWDFNTVTASDYVYGDGITFSPSNVSVDLEFTSLGLPPLTPEITDLWYNGSNIMGAAINADDVVAYSINDGPWGILNLDFGTTGAAAKGINIKRIVDGGAFNFVFGLGTTAESGTNNGDNAAVVYGTMSPSSLEALNYISLPTADSFTAGVSYQGRLYAGMIPKTISDDNMVSVSQDLLDPTFFTIGNPGQIISINNFLVVAGKLYATITQSVATGGDTKIWVSSNGVDWVETVMDDPVNTAHDSTHSIVSDTEGYIYVTTNSDYILKSTFPAGNEFTKIYLPAGSSTNGLIYADDANNIWIPLTDGGVLRSNDYTGGVGATDFFRMNTEISFSGGNILKIEDAIKISNGKIIWAGSVWNNDVVAGGVGWSSRTYEPQTIINKTGLEEGRGSHQDCPFLFDVNLCKWYSDRVKFNHLIMKKDIHPNYFPNAKIQCACGNIIEAGSTLEKVAVEVCSACHPLYTGKQKFIDKAGRVEKFLERAKKSKGKTKKSK